MSMAGAVPWRIFTEPCPGGWSRYKLGIVLALDLLSRGSSRTCPEYLLGAMVRRARSHDTYPEPSLVTTGPGALLLAITCRHAITVKITSKPYIFSTILHR